MKVRIVTEWDIPEAIVIYTQREIPANSGRLMTYVHNGQHGEATMAFIATCRKPLPHERNDCAALLRELDVSEKKITQLTGRKPLRN